jgi:hypothetical protein
MHQTIIPFKYTVTRHRLPVGVTDLSFTRFDDQLRAGWFFPCLSPAVAAAFDWQRQFDFELRCPDGSIVATEWIGIQDTERLLAVGAEREEDTLDTDPWFDDDWTDEPDWNNAGEPEWTPERPDWMPDVEAADLPRYQILVRLAAPSAIP